MGSTDSSQLRPEADQSSDYGAFSPQSFSPAASPRSDMEKQDEHRSGDHIGEGGTRREAKRPTRLPSKHVKGHGSHTLQVPDDATAQKQAKLFRFPSIAVCVAIQIVVTFGQVVYMLTAWMFCGLVRHKLFPNCEEVWPTSTIGAQLCYTSSILFWTFPLFCSLLLLIFFYRDLLFTELYYQLLCHNVYIDFENVDFFASSSVRVMLVYLAGGVSFYFFAGEVTLERFLYTIPYWLPVQSFLSSFFLSWDLESRLLSLARFTEKNFDKSALHIHESAFLKDYMVRAALIDLNKELDDESSRGEKSVTSLSEYIQRMIRKIEEIESQTDHPNFDYKKPKIYKHGKENMLTPIYKGRSYWATSFLLRAKLTDQSARSFRFWLLVYIFYTLIMVVWLLYLMQATTVTHLGRQHILGDWFTDIFGADGVLRASELKAKFR